MRNAKSNWRVRVKAALCVLSSVALAVGGMYLFGGSVAKSAYCFSFGAPKATEIEIPEFKTEPSDEQSAAASDETESAPPPAAATSGDENAVVVNLSALSGKYKNYGGTSLINNTDYDVSSLMYADYEKPEPAGDEPYVLIYHTHTSEEYYGGGTVVDVGNAMAEQFESLGYKTVHITEVYDKEQFSGAYSRSIKGIEAALEKYPSIKLCFDIHRDSITAGNGEDYRPLTEVDGRECAQVMLVCGTDSKGLSHPNWRENFKFALDISRRMGEDYGALSRPVNLRADRFNTHVTNYSLLLEVGSDANSVDEAKTAAVYTALSIVKTIENQK